MEIVPGLITVSSIVGNIRGDPRLAEVYHRMAGKNMAESITISRSESQRSRMRKRSDKGTDIAFTLDQGVHIRHRDVVMLTENKIVVIDIEPEDVAMIEVKENSKDYILNLVIRIGHIIGNLHRPIKIEENRIFFPIQADTEIDMLRNLLHPIADHVEIKKTSMIFEPEEEMKVHAH